VDGLSGWAVGDFEVILHTTNGGVSWHLQTASTASPGFNAVAFTNAQSGWVVGYGGTILHTADGGASWLPQASRTSQDLFGVAVADAQSAWAGRGGTIVHTTDGGESWQVQENFQYRRFPAPWFYLAVFCLVPLLLWAATPTVVRNRTSIEELVASDSPVTSLGGCRREIS
jgi:hypothetical protein